MNCIIVDDEPIARQGMINLIHKVPFLELKGVFREPMEARPLLDSSPIHLAFLDIRMPGINGLSFARTLPEQVMVIFTTAYAKHALESFEVNTIDYLTKPISEERFLQAIEKVKRIWNFGRERTEQKQHAMSIMIRADRKFHHVHFQDILYVEGMKDYVTIYLTKNRKLITAINLKNIRSKLPGDIFSRISKSYIVNKRHITSMNNRSVYIKDIRIPLGEIFREQFRKDCSNDPCFP
ncbi:MAG: response regulator transcription factor, partial [Chitinophagaceae bacterium]|nr:response regulator transcription factor [Chitinophagaceae bacterium]